MEDFEFGSKNKNTEPVEFEFGKKSADLVFEFVKQPPEAVPAPKKEEKAEAPAAVDVFSAAEMDKFGTASLVTRSTSDVINVQMFLTMLLRMACLSIAAQCTDHGSPFTA